MTRGLSPRIQALRSAMEADGLDAVLVSSPENRVYLSQFTGSDGYLLVSRDSLHLATDSRYFEQAHLQSKEFNLIQLKAYAPAWLTEISSNLGLRKVGFEGSHLTFSAYRGFIQSLSAAQKGIELVPCSAFLDKLRETKDAEELTAIAKAAGIAHSSMSIVVGLLRPGLSEKEIAWKLECVMHEKGSERPAFETIVASGPNGALPHWSPSDRPVEEGQPIVIDYGCTVDGYCCDITRTVWSGDPGEQLAKVYDIVSSAQRTAIELIKEGMNGAEADETGRIVVEEAGYGKAFGHGLGHGIGLKVHENPRLGPNSQDVLRNGMVFTIEPGIYLAGWGGVRIEDSVVMESGKLRVLR